MSQPRSSLSWIWNGLIELDKPHKGRKPGHIDSILTHPINTWQPHPKLELRVGFGIPVNKILDTKTAPLIYPILQRATCTLKIGSGTGRFELDSRQKDRNEHSMIDSILTHPIKDLVTSSLPRISLRIRNSHKPILVLRPSHEHPQCYHELHRPPFGSGTGRFELDSPPKGQKWTLYDRFHPHSSDKRRSNIILTSNFVTDSEFP